MTRETYKERFLVLAEFTAKLYEEANLEMPEEFYAIDEAERVISALMCKALGILLEKE